jgi:signal peptidase II
MQTRFKLLHAILIVLVMLFLDQWLKIWVKTNMYPGEEIRLLGNWFKLHYTENNGMAFGIELAGRVGKLILTLFRIVAVVGIGYFLVKSFKEKYHIVFQLSISLVMAGAIGNIIDSVFYGVYYGYEELFYGRVVDMFYAPIIETILPGWIPMVGGTEFVFFRPVFNLADACISVGLVLTLIFQKRIFEEGKLKSYLNHI